jgi:hypothetical protein
MMMMMMMIIIAFWDIAPYSLVVDDVSDVYTTLSIIRAIKRLYAPWRLWHNIPEGYHLHTHCRENLKSHIVYYSLTN